MLEVRKMPKTRRQTILGSGQYLFNELETIAVTLTLLFSSNVTCVEKLDTDIYVHVRVLS